MNRATPERDEIMKISITTNSIQSPAVFIPPSHIIHEANRRGGDSSNVEKTTGEMSGKLHLSSNLNGEG